MIVAGLIMQQLCMNKFISTTTGATISSAQLGILLALLFMPSSTIWGRAVFSFITAILGTWIFVWFIQKVKFKDVVMVPLVILAFIFANHFNIVRMGRDFSGGQRQRAYIAMIIAQDTEYVLLDDPTL